MYIIRQSLIGVDCSDDTFAARVEAANASRLHSELCRDKHGLLLYRTLQFGQRSEYQSSQVQGPLLS
jgi:hypothetical protein